MALISIQIRQQNFYDRRFNLRQYKWWEGGLWVLSPEKHLLGPLPILSHTQL
jgi:hypothetical protein